MKKFIALLFLCVTLLVSCKKSQNLLFCAGGITPDGKPAECGTEFYSGELTVIIKKDSPFGVSNISVVVYELQNQKQTELEKITVTVDPEKKEAHTNITLLNGGVYIIKALSDTVTLAEGSVKIVD